MAKSKRWSMIVLSIVLTGCFLSRGQAVRMSTSSEIPAAEGTAKASTTDNGNTILKVEVRHLARPEKVATGATTYVVWAKDDQGSPQNLGALRVDENLKGTLETVTPLESFHVFITAEPSGTMAEPTSDHLFTATIPRPAD
jgi:hypothetical protein